MKQESPKMSSSDHNIKSLTPTETGTVVVMQQETSRTGAAHPGGRVVAAAVTSSVLDGARGCGKAEVEAELISLLSS